VVATARRIAESEGLEPRRAELAAWTHDLCREWNGDGLCSYVDQSRFPLTVTEQERDVLCHGPAAATVLRSVYHICDPEILEAVRWHTTGNAGLRPLAKVVYAADYLEPGRPYTTEEFRQGALQKSLDAMVLAVLNHVMERKLALAPETEALYDEVSRNVQ
jgi:nicotinate-nucleotide adenylyltransferase